MKGQKCKGRKRRLYWFCGIGIILLTFLMIIAIKKKRDSAVVVNQDNVITYDNGDVIYNPQEENLAFDDESCTIYYNNLLMAFLTQDLSEKEAQNLADKVDGVIVGQIRGNINYLQIQVKNTDLKKLEWKASKLMKSDNVFYASYEYPMYVTSESVDVASSGNINPWGKDKKKNHDGNESDPDGNDWWAEAIGAYTAWKYDNWESNIKVGIIDSGFLTTHEDLTDDEGKSVISMSDNFEENTVDSHGTHVAGIIGARNNTVGIRGIVDKANLICADWNITKTVTDNDGNEEELEFSRLSSGEFIEITKQMIEDGVKVINNSWGIQLLSEKKYNMQNFYVPSVPGFRYNSYTSYIKATEKLASDSAMFCACMIGSLLSNNKKDFLIVQSSGNGYDSIEKMEKDRGNDTILNGYYCAINEENIPEIIIQENEMITFEDIREHILIVGAVKNEVDKEGNYKITDFSNYGDNIDIVAPGEDIFSTTDINSDSSFQLAKWTGQNNYFATNEEDSNTYYQDKDGTSMAAPMVAGAAAYLKSLDSSLSPSEIKDYLINNAGTAIGVTEKDKGQIYPMLNIGKAVNKLMIDKREQFAKRAYEGIINQYKTLCNVSEFDWFDRYDEYLAKYPNVNPYVMFNYHMDDHTYYYGDSDTGYDYPYEIVYQLYDVDKNGTPELLIAQSFKGEMGEKYKLCDMYAFDGVKAVKLFPEQTFLGDVEQFLVDAYEGADIGQLYIYDEPGLVGVVSGDASYYKFSADGYSLESYRTHEQFWGQHEIVSTFTDEDWTVIGEDVVFTAPDLDNIYKEYGNDFGKAMVRVLPNDNRYYYYLVEKYFGKNYSAGNNQEYGWENLIWDNEDMEISLENLGDDIGYWFRTIKYKTDSYKFLDVCIGDRYKDAVRTIQHYAKEIGFEFYYGDDTGNPNESQYYMEFKEGRSYCATGCMVTFEMDSYDRITGMVIQFD